MRAARRALASGLAAVTALGLAVAAPASTAAQPTAAATPAETPRMTDLDPGVYPITLITGDEVTLTVAPDQTVQIALEAARRTDGSTPGASWHTSGDGIFVLPEDVRAPVADGRLDPKLFDVEYLAANGFTDQETATLPLIVEHAAGVGARQAGVAATTAEVTPLPSIDASAVEVVRSEAENFWGALRQGWPGEQTRARARAAVERVWLDRPMKLVLDESVPQIGAPEAWRVGLDGAGVRVAVLDSGIDATHPDVAGRIVAARNFIAAGEPVDNHGHGTHVSTTVLGTGAASGGQYRGVAPAADLIVGKICDDGGDCPTSTVIAGMEWAAGEQRAKVINLSIGGCCSDGTDPLSQAVNQLSADTGALFVVAAGNDGGAGQIGAPGTADAALTVGAVDKSGQLAWFTSKGPRLGDSAFKPEIAAPGVNIVAGRASGTEMGTPVNDHYTSANGTSMATPHVTGAAALLAQQHPDWTGEQLKTALVASAQDLGHDGYAQGAGRVDIARAITTTLRVSPVAADFRFLPDPQDGDPAVRRTLTYDNPTSEPVTVRLTTAGFPDGALTLDQDTLTVPAAASASVTVSLAPTALPAGKHTGSVTATAGDQRLATPVAATVGDQQHRVTVRLTDRDCANGVHCTGAASSFGFSPVFLIRYDDSLETGGGPGTVSGLPTMIPVPATTATTDATTDGTAEDWPDHVLEVFAPPGRYLVVTTAGWRDADTNRDQEASLVAPEVVVDGPTTVDFDANRLVKVRHQPPRPVGDGLAGSYAYHRSHPALPWPIAGGGINAFGGANYWAYPSEPVTEGKFLVSYTDVLEAPQVRMSLTGEEPVALHPIYSGYRPLSTDHWTVPVRFPEGTSTLGVVDVGDGLSADYAGKDVTGKLVLVRKIGHPIDCGIKMAQLRAALSAGAAGVVYHLAHCDAGTYIHEAPANKDKPQIPYAAVPGKEGDLIAERLRTGPVTIRVTNQTVSPYTYFVKSYERNGVPDSMLYRYPDNEMVRVQASYHARQDAWSRHYWTSRPADEPFLMLQAYEFATPVSRTEYIAPGGPDVRHERLVAPSLGATPLPGGPSLTRIDQWAKPETLTERWHAEPVVPGAYIGPRRDWAADCAGCREDDRLWPTAMLTSGEPDLEGRWIGIAEPTTADPERQWAGLKLFRNGAPVPLEEFEERPDLPSFPVPDEVSDYRLVMDLSTYDRSRTEWTYRSGATTGNQAVTEDYNCRRWFTTDLPCRAEPLIFLRYSGLDTDLYDRVSTHGPHRFEVSTYRQPTASPQPAVTGLKLWTSYDGGRRWHQAKVRSAGDGRFAVQVNHRPAVHRATNSVTLRVEAWDARGNRVQQTIPDAYLVTGR